MQPLPGVSAQHYPATPSETKADSQLGSRIFLYIPALLKEAYKERLIKENINDFLEAIEYEEVKKNFLTADEVKALARTPV